MICGSVAEQRYLLKGRRVFVSIIYINDVFVPQLPATNAIMTVFSLFALPAAHNDVARWTFFLLIASGVDEERAVGCEESAHGE